jgi:hypothetical protein
MKKFILFFAVIIIAFLGLSCSKGDTGPTGAQGLAGPTGNDGYLVMQFQDGNFPSSTYTGTRDTRIVNGVTSTYNFGDCSNLEFGNDVGRVLRLLISFDVSAISVSATVKSAYLTMYCNSANGSVDAVVYKVTKNWTEGTGDCGGTPNVNASWNYYNGSANAWTTPGGDYDVATQSEVKTVTTAGYYTIKLNTQMVQEWVNNPSQNYGLIVKSLNETSGDLVNSDKKSTDVTQRPKLTIYYTLP